MDRKRNLLTPWKKAMKKKAPEPEPQPQTEPFEPVDSYDPDHDPFNDNCMCDACLAARAESAEDIDFLREVSGALPSWQLVTSAASENGSCQAETSALEVLGLGCLVNISRRHRNLDGSYTISESLAWCPGMKLITDGGGLTLGIQEGFKHPSR